VVSPHHIHAAPQKTPEVLDTSLEHALPTSSGQHGQFAQVLHSDSSGLAPEPHNISTLWRLWRTPWPAGSLQTGAGMASVMTRYQTPRRTLLLTGRAA